MPADPHRDHVKDLADAHLKAGDPMGWFEALYASAEGQLDRIPWADRRPNHHLLEWLKRDTTPAGLGRVLVVGCGLGDDAVILAPRAKQVVAFDISPTAIDWCHRRFRETNIEFCRADLFNALPEWSGAFDLVFESYTLQALPLEVREKAFPILPTFVAPGGRLLVVARARRASDALGRVPWPLTRDELERLEEYGLTLQLLEEFFDSETPPVRRFRAEYVRSE